MLQKLMERRRKGQEEGFTLIELMVVVLIIAILIAIAIPTFLGARTRAQDRSAQSDIRNAFTASKTLFTDNDQYDATANQSTDLHGVEPSLTFVGDVAPSAKHTVSVWVTNSDANHTNDVIVLGAKSDSGTCFYLKDQSGGPGTTYSKGGESCVTPSTATAADASF